MLEDGFGDFTNLKISIIGLGLMGGSLAYALKGFRNCEITGYDVDENTAEKAVKTNAVDKIAASLKDAVSEANLTIFCTNPHNIIEDMRKIARYFKKYSVVTDICGVKEKILSLVSDMRASGELSEYVDYIGIHPMAGKEVNGFVNADSGIYNKAGFILILPEQYRRSSLELIKELSVYVGADRMCVNSAEEHDRIIAYTSDLMHISAASLCVDYPENMTMTHTAGAFRDCTRIANIKADLWTDLLTENSEHIIPHLELYIKNLTDFRNALVENNQEFICNFLKTACENKKEMQKK